MGQNKVRSHTKKLEESYRPRTGELDKYMKGIRSAWENWRLIGLCQSDPKIGFFLIRPNGVS